MEQHLDLDSFVAWTTSKIECFFEVFYVIHWELTKHVLMKVDNGVRHKLSAICKQDIILEKISIENDSKP